MHQTTLRMPYQDFVFRVWTLSSSPAILKKLIYIYIYQRIMTLTIERSGNASQNCWFIKCMQKLEKSIVQYLLIWILCHKQQDPGKSWKNTFFNTFLIKILIGKAATNSKIRKLEKTKFQYYFDEKIHQDPGKSWKIKISILFYLEL